MTTDEVLGSDPADLRCCQRLTRQLQNGVCSYEEYFRAMTDAIIRAHSEDMATCLQQIPSEIFPQYAGDLRAYLEPVDFMPEATQWLAANRTEEKHEAIRRELRPKYLRLTQLVQERLRSKTVQ